MLKALLPLLFVLFISAGSNAQTIIYNGCAEQDIPTNLTLNKDPSTTTDASISRNIYYADIMPGGQPGYLVVSWSTVRHRWEIFFNTEQGLSPDGPVIRLYYHSSSGAPRPPATGWTIDSEGGCTTPATLTGDVLPIQLLSFAAEKSQAEIALKWSTAKEFNFERFEVERSSTGMNFRTIAVVNSNSGLSHNYFISDAIAKTVVFYRLKLVDKDGTFTHSNVLTVQPGKITSLSLYPNPSQNYLQVSVPAIPKAKLALQIINVSGQVVSSGSYNNNNGSVMSMLMDITQLKKGGYLLRVIASDYTESVRFFKQ